MLRELVQSEGEEHERALHFRYERRMCLGRPNACKLGHELVDGLRGLPAVQERQHFLGHELEKLHEMYDLQMDRIKIDVENEKKINKLFPSTGREIFYAMKILNQASELKMNLGIAKRQLGEVSVTGAAAVQIADRYSDGVGKVMSDPDSRRKVLGMVETLMMVGARAKLDAAEIVASAAQFVDGNVIDVDSSEPAPDPGDDPMPDGTSIDE